MILYYSLYELVPKLLFLLGKTRVWTKNWKKEQKIEKKGEIQSSGTEVQIFKTCDELRIDNWGLLRSIGCNEKLKRHEIY